jgi:hypothetical protein
MLRRRTRENVGSWALCAIVFLDGVIVKVGVVESLC